MALQPVRLHVIRSHEQPFGLRAFPIDTRGSRSQTRLTPGY